MTYDLQIVSHVWAKEMPQYAAFAKYQMHSLRRFPPARASASVILTVCFAGDDSLAAWTVMDQCKAGFPPNVTLRPWAMSQKNLFRRAYARNEVCKVPDGRVLWFTDCDYVFGEGTLDAVIGQVGPDSQLVFPAETLCLEWQKMGESYVRNAAGNDFPEVDPADFVTGQNKRAIGGIQIIGARLARQIGYDPPMKTPYDYKVFGCFKDDANWRRYVRLPAGMVNVDGNGNVGPGSPIAVPNLYRIRHQENGYERTE